MNAALLAQALAHHRQGNFAEAFSAAAPTGLKNVGKGWTQWDKGYATDAGGRKLVDVGGIGAIMQGDRKAHV